MECTQVNDLSSNMETLSLESNNVFFHQLMKQKVKGNNINYYIQAILIANGINTSHIYRDNNGDTFIKVYVAGTSYSLSVKYDNLNFWINIESGTSFNLYPKMYIDNLYKNDTDSVISQKIATLLIQVYHQYLGY